MEFYGNIIEIDNNPRPTILIRQRDSEVLWRISLNDPHLIANPNAIPIIVVSGNILADTTQEIIERMVILEIKPAKLPDPTVLLSPSNCLNAQVFVHTRHL